MTKQIGNGQYRRAIKLNLQLKFLLYAFLVTAISCKAQIYGPIDVAKMVFAKPIPADLQKHSAGEYKGDPNGHDLPAGARTHFRLLDQTETSAVVSMTVLDSADNGVDTYLYFSRDTVWKITAFRALAMTGIIETYRNQLQNMTPQQVDSVITGARAAKRGQRAMFDSKEDYEFQLGNATLTLALDEKIKSHFETNRAAFEAIKDVALEQASKLTVDEERSLALVENLERDYRKLFVASVSTGGYELGNCLNFHIGGMLDNAVGYIFVKDKKDLPVMNPARVIMIREIGNGWYIYKTT